MAENIRFNGRSYNRYPESNRSSHQKYFNRAGGNGLLHRDVWEHHNGPVPKGHHVHHIDGDTTNNCITNLECLPSKEHFKLHVEDRKKHGISNKNLEHLSLIREKAKEWHKSDEGKAWHKAVSTQYLELAHDALRKKREQQAKNPFSVKCEECGELFPSPTGRAKVCSQTCHNRRSRRKKRLARMNKSETE